MTAGRLDIAVERWTPFDETIDFVGLDFTGSTFTLQVRAYQDAPGAALIDLSNQAAPGQGLSVSVVTTDGIPTSALRIIINETTLEALLPFPTNGTEPGASVRLVYALHITPSGGKKKRWLEGSFTIIPGANQA